MLPIIERPKAELALVQIGWARTPSGNTWINIQSAGTVAISAAGFATERKKFASPGRMVRERISIPAAVTPATRARAINPSKTRRTGVAQIRTIRRRRAFDTSMLNSV
jgi:hypothetical protein